MNQWPLIVDDSRQDQLPERSLFEFGRAVDVADDFAAEQPQVVAVQVAGLTRQPLGQHVQQKRCEHRNDVLAGNDVALLATPACRPRCQIRAVAGQVWCGYDRARFFLECFWHASDLLPPQMSAKDAAVLLAQITLLHLACTANRQRVQKDDVVGHPPLGDALGQEGQDFFALDRFAGLAHDEE
jgi:hypothetical protein